MTSPPSTLIPQPPLQRRTLEGSEAIDAEVAASKKMHKTYVEICNLLRAERSTAQFRELAALDARLAKGELYGKRKKDDAGLWTRAANAMAEVEVEKLAKFAAVPRERVVDVLGGDVGGKFANSRRRP